MSIKLKIIACLGILFGAGLIAQEGPGFEIYNKSSNTVWVAVVNGDQYVIKDVRSMVARMVSIDITKPTYFGIWTKEPVNPRVELSTFLGKVQILPQPYKVYTFDVGKTVYVTWDDQLNLRPQTGPLGGLLRTTRTGLSLQNNVNTANIKLKVSQ